MMTQSQAQLARASSAMGNADHNHSRSSKGMFDPSTMLVQNNNTDNYALKLQLQNLSSPQTYSPQQTLAHMHQVKNESPSCIIRRPNQKGSQATDGEDLLHLQPQRYNRGHGFGENINTESNVVIAAAEESTQTFFDVNDPQLRAELQTIQDFASKKERMQKERKLYYPVNYHSRAPTVMELQNQKRQNKDTSQESITSASDCQRMTLNTMQRSIAQSQNLSTAPRGGVNTAMKYLGKAMVASAQSSQHQTLQTRLSSAVQGTLPLNDEISATEFDMRYYRPKTSAEQHYPNRAGIMSPTVIIQANSKNMSRQDKKIASMRSSVNDQDKPLSVDFDSIDASCQHRRNHHQNAQQRKMRPVTTRSQVMTPKYGGVRPRF